MNIRKNLIACYKANNFPIRVLIDYFRFSSKSELLFDLYLPFIISSFFIFGFVNNLTTVEMIITAFSKINNDVITAISILAGFNFASISLLASSNSKTISDLKDRISDQFSSDSKQVTHFDMVLMFFSWAIIVQIITIAFMIILSIFINLSPSLGSISNFIFKLLIIVWCTLVAHSLLITIRNVKNMYFFMKYKNIINK